MKNPLLDREFLKKLDQHNEREVYAKLVSLTYDEDPVSEIQGSVTQGSVNIDGASSVRRTCNLTLVTNSINVNEFEWALNTKFIVYLGLKNFIDDTYEDIIWFKQGMFIISSFSSSLNAQGYTITIQGKDKMCLLNGDVGGNLFAQHDFGVLWTKQSDGSYTKDKIPIKTIIREALHVYGLEQYSNIIVNDVESCSVELLAYRSKKPVIYIYNLYPNTNPDNPDYNVFTSQMAFGGSIIASLFENKFLDDDGRWTGDNSARFTADGRDYSVVKRVSYGDTVGYRLTDLTYAGDLVIALNGTITQMLDNIVKMLGEFEYFYDVDGRFIFQRKRIYFNMSWSNAITNENESTYYDTATNTSALSYEFNNGLLIESFQNKPNINNIKNDYSIWGTRQGITATIPIHLRYAIDIKPKFYYSLTKKQLYTTPEFGGRHDWRELLYQMAFDNAQLRGKMENLIEESREEITELISKTLGLEIAEVESQYDQTWNSGYDAYYADLLAFWPSLYRTTPSIAFTFNSDGTVVKDKDGNLETVPDDMNLNYEDWSKWVNNNYYNPELIKWDDEEQIIRFLNPESLNFWFDFLDVESDLGKYQVSLIGRRPKVVNDADVKSIFYRDIPQLLFTTSDNPEYQDGDLSYIRMNLPPSLENYFSISSQGKSAKEALDNLLYNNTYYQESITISCVPIYYLEPNTRISVYDEASGINGEYLIKSISIQLSHDGMMSITATKAEEEIL